METTNPRMIASPTGVVAPPLPRVLKRTDSKPWFRQFWPWFLIALPATSVVFSFATLYIAVRDADEVLPHQGDSTSYSAPRGPAVEAAPATPVATNRAAAHVRGAPPEAVGVAASVTNAAAPTKTHAAGERAGGTNAAEVGAAAANARARGANAAESGVP